MLRPHAQGGARVWGGVPPAWQQAFPALPTLDGDGDSCPICFDPYDDLLPRPPEAPETTRGLPTVAECGLHATCVRCDIEMQRRVNFNVRRLACPLCRAPRVRHTPVVPNVAL